MIPHFTFRLLADSQDNFGVPVDTAGEAVVAAMQHLGVRKIAVGSRWADEVNNTLIQYLEDAGIEVLPMTSRGFAGCKGAACRVKIV